MEASKLKEKVNKTEEEILHLLNKLMYETGTKINGLDVTTFRSMSKQGLEAISVSDLKIIFTF